MRSCKLLKPRVNVREDAVTDLQGAKEARQELISQHEATVETLKEQVGEYWRLIVKQEVQNELAPLQSLKVLRQKTNDLP